MYLITFILFQVYFSGNDAEVHLYVRICYSKYSSYFTWFIYMIEGGLLTFGAFLAWESRHVMKLNNLFTLCILMFFPIHIDTTIMGMPILI